MDGLTLRPRTPSTDVDDLIELSLLRILAMLAHGDATAPLRATRATAARFYRVVCSWALVAPTPAQRSVMLELVAELEARVARSAQALEPKGAAAKASKARRLAS